MARVAIFADCESVAARVLLPALLRAIEDRPGWEAGAIWVVQRSLEPNRFGEWRRRLLRVGQVALRTGRWDATMSCARPDLHKLSALYGSALVSLPEGNPNHEDMLARLDGDCPADVAFNLFVRSRFQESLLGRFVHVVNYHNGSLPRFRGLRASNWSLYNGDMTSGFTFHLMDQEIDAGEILLEDSVEIGRDMTASDLEYAKAMRAGECVDEVLHRPERGHFHSQNGVCGVLNREAWQLVTRLEDPGSLSAEEWCRRLRAFLRIEARFGGAYLGVTGVGLGKPGQSLAFVTADGVCLRVTAIDYFPAWMRRFRT